MRKNNKREYIYILDLSLSPFFFLFKDFKKFKMHAYYSLINSL